MTPPDEPTTALFRALMHPTRLAILDLLRHSEQCVCHLEAHLGKRQAYISQQLMVLREAGLVADERQGLHIYYRVTDPRVFVLIDVARAMYGVEAEAHHSCASDAACPCPRCSPVAEVVLFN